jgi:hypothetical protein
MLPRQQIDRISSAGRDFFGWIIFGLLLFVVIAHALNSNWQDSVKCLVFAIAICPLVPLQFEVRAAIGIIILFSLWLARNRLDCVNSFGDG